MPHSKPPRIVMPARRLYRWTALLCFAGAALLLWTAGIPRPLDYVGLGLRDGSIIAPVVGAYAPPLTLMDVTGQPIHPPTARITLINFWATWCLPCEAEMPALQALHARYQANGLYIIGVNMGETPQTVQAWADRLGLTFALGIDHSGQTVANYRLRGQPTTVIVAPNGRITAILYGAVDLPALERAITPFLDANTATEG